MARLPSRRFSIKIRYFGELYIAKQRIAATNRRIDFLIIIALLANQPVCPVRMFLSSAFSSQNLERADSCGNAPAPSTEILQESRPEEAHGYLQAKAGWLERNS